MQCTSCHYHNQSMAKVCSNCGLPITASNQSYSTARQKPAWQPFASKSTPSILNAKAQLSATSAGLSPGGSGWLPQVSRQSKQAAIVSSFPSKYYHLRRATAVVLFCMVTILGLVIIGLSLFLLGNVLGIMTICEGVAGNSTLNFGRSGNLFAPVKNSLLGAVAMGINLLAISLFIWLFHQCRQQWSKATLAKNVVGGEVRDLQQRVEQQPTLMMRFLMFSNSKTIWTFRLEQHNSVGSRLQPIPVELRGYSIGGLLSNGDQVEIPASWQLGDTLRPISVCNMTTGGYVTVKTKMPFSSILWSFIAAWLAFHALTYWQFFWCWNF